MGEARAAGLVGQLRGQLERLYPKWGVGNLAVAGAGLTFLVCRAEALAFGTVAIRVPWARAIVNDNDGELDARTLLAQEAAVAEYVERHGVASPTVHALHLGDDGFDFMVSAFVVGDASPPDQREFGRLMRALHDCPPPDLALVEQGGLPGHRRVARRLTGRAAAFARLTGEALPLPGEGEIAAILAPRAGHRALLHMDARPANLFTRQGAIVAIADWGNALIGDPTLELARIAEMGHLDATFEAGYGDEHRLDWLPPAIETIYRLDAAVMLAVVFLAEAPDPEMARMLVGRAKELAARFG